MLSLLMFGSISRPPGRERIETTLFAVVSRKPDSISRPPGRERIETYRCSIS